MTQKTTDLSPSQGRDRLKILKYISGREWGADATTLKLTYTSLIRPILEYGYQIYGTASETNLKSLERIQLSAARIITGLRNTCPNDIVLYEADIMPLKDRRSYNLPKYINKIKSYGNKHRTSNYILNWESNLRLKKEGPLHLAKRNGFLKYKNEHKTKKELAKTLGVTQPAIFHHLKEMGMIRKVGNWVPYELKPRNVEHHFFTHEQLFQRQKRKGVLHQIVTGDEKWVHYDNSKRRAMYEYDAFEPSIARKNGCNTPIDTTKEALPIDVSIEGEILHPQPGQAADDGWLSPTFTLFWQDRVNSATKATSLATVESAVVYRLGFTDGFSQYLLYQLVQSHWQKDKDTGGMVIRQFLPKIWKFEPTLVIIKFHD
ncbi:CNOT6L [Cordylochernes scorpioides]|uniref:CNOT6L n=1 Tax=Cordylochernes scorpioides TaxID=51811 RepID=A0ABY6KQE6_9ARAC|nr:CNOT6L [Cordylochernes scorpioides]